MQREQPFEPSRTGLSEILCARLFHTEICVDAFLGVALILKQSAC
jgi:hypothetical protein